MERKELYGAGWEFPPRFDKIENTATMLEGEEKIVNSIYIILHTKLGERILRNDFGSNIYDLMFEPLNANMKTFMSSTLRSSLERNEPRIKVLNLTLDQPNPSEGLVDIHIEFLSIEKNVIQNLVIPFYLSEDFK